jgi:C-terminal processing protease CtpA/Prc
VRITISRWFTPQHHSVHPDGVQPDITVEIPEGTPPEKDLVLDRAVQYLSTRAVGEGASPSIAPAASGRPTASDETSYDTSGLTESAA